ncbi:ABC transporter substrate-binding protein [Phyllobacterium sophorae]|uniref:ABC transporter substrate-binding protein n=1 Tax=Phyllobacterium sophorae TaxID=1520277 RepID=A0A2P7BFD5_9HYPH|nr:ABC transporter substrate-binding protein [Phyllobacterium sophorae]PSH65187.1 ABC transporter substrate-binding protein [Phyllobacterium sophorae]
MTYSDSKSRKRLLRRASALLAAVSAATIFLSASYTPAVAETPPDTLVEAFALDELITLDPAEAFEVSSGEITGNSYDRLVRLDINDPSKIVADIADSWTVSDDGLTYTFKLKPGLKFASGNPITAEDVAWSFERAIKLDKSPALILAQFGLKADNVTEKAKATDPSTFVFTVDQPYAPSFVLNCLTATVASVVDKKLASEHVVNDDFGNAWLKTGYAGSGAWKIRDWRANEIIVLERNDNYYGTKAPLNRVIYRHVKESAAQRLLLEKGDIDVARNLESNDLEQVVKNKNIATTSAPKGTIYYFSLNQKNRNLAKPEVRQALKYLVDYDAIGEKLIKGIGEIHQTFLPKGILGELDDNPYKLDVQKAKALLAKAGLKDGFSVTIDARNTQPVTGIAESLQQTFAQGGVKLDIIPGDGKQTLTKYRARTHDIFIGPWGTDYWDPNSNADTFTNNPNNSDEGTNKTLAWRNAWDVPDLTKETKTALLESNGSKRAEAYRELQRQVLATSPFVVLFQQTEVAAYRSNLHDYKLASFGPNPLSTISK